ncbi:MAG TPA: nuclear transport factor 2 family protein [Flavobacteriales bacterium]|nr:nuclear transport factor 2 family protein [Flavobacteriales bacterium]
MTTGARRLLLLLIIAKPVYVNAQASASITPVYDDKNGIAVTITTFFDGFTKGDTNLIKSMCHKNMSLQTVVDREGQTTSIKQENWSAFLKQIAAPHKGKFEERIVNWDIRVDGKYANAWCKYKVIIDDTIFNHWGIDNFQLLKDAGKWYILSITDTRRSKKTYVEEVDLAKITSEYVQNNYPTYIKTKEELSLQINELMNTWHKAAAVADEKVFFDFMMPGGIYLGTDKTENWTKEVFEEWSKKYFEKDKAWDFKPYDRHIYFTEDKSYAWFDELLDTWMGVSRGSGVLKYENGTWKLMHYNLAVTVPNEKIKEFVKINK